MLKYGTSTKSEIISPSIIFYIFVCLHFLSWTLVPALVRHNLPLDAIEGAIWGHQLEWGYDKNPFLNGWLTAFAAFLDHHQGWMTYVFSQLSVSICFIAVWRLANKILAPTCALIAVLLLEFVQYYNFHAIDFNDNTLELGLWALASYYFYFAQTTSYKRFWILTGLCCGLGMMAKYYTATLILAMLLYMLRYRWQQFKTFGPYLGIMTGLIIMSPHMHWLCQHDFLTIRYVMSRGESEATWWSHFHYPVIYIGQQLQAFFPSLIIYAFFFLTGKIKAVVPTSALRDRAFFWYLGCIPILSTACLSLLFGTYLRAGWGMPLLSFWGILLVSSVPPTLTKKRLHLFLATTLLLVIAMLSAYAISIINSSDTSSANFPGRRIATDLTQAWHDRYHRPLKIVAGSRWVGGNINFYSIDHPAVFIEWRHDIAPWIDQASLKKTGAIFVWDESDNEQLPTAVRAQYPTLLKSKILTYHWLRERHRLPPIKIGYAFLPPT